MKKMFSLEVSAIKNETNEVISIYFNSSNLAYNPGDCVDIEFPERLELGRKTFSFASSPDEESVFITYKKGITKYKKYMESLMLGQKVNFIHYGSNFVFHAGKKSIFIAGGVGIAPLRSMIYSSIASKKENKLVLIYLNSDNNFPFQKELEDWSLNYPGLVNHFINSSIEGRISKEMLIEKIPDIVSDYDFYISGPPLMLDATMEILSEMGLEDEIIHTDSFDGYTEELE